MNPWIFENLRIEPMDFFQEYLLKTCQMAVTKIWHLEVGQQLTQKRTLNPWIEIPNDAPDC